MSSWWTNKDIQYLMLWWGKKPAIQISRDLGRPDQAASQMAFRLELPSNYESLRMDKIEVNLDSLRFLIESGLRAKSIAMDLDIGVSTVYRRVKRLEPYYRDMLRDNGKRYKASAISIANNRRINDQQKEKASK